MENIDDHKFIVLCYDHYNPLGIIRSLGQEGIKPIVILAAENPCLIPRCKYISTLHNTLNVEESFQLLLEKYGSEKLKPFLFTSDDTAESKIDCYYDDLKDRFFSFIGKKKGTITNLMNKNSINQLAVQCGFRIPQSQVLSHGQLPDQLNYPIMTKAITSLRSGWKDDVFICNSKNELIEAYPEIKSETILAQEYITKKNELCLDGFSINNGKNIFIPYKVTFNRFSKKSYGAFVNVSPFKDAALLSKIQRIIEYAGFNGMFEVEFLVDENDCLYFLEVNFRSSIWNYAFTYGGVNLPFLWAKSTLTNTLCKGNNSLKEHFTAMNEIADFKENVISGDMHFFKWLSEFKKTDCLLYFNKKDIVPFVSKVTRYLSRNGTQVSHKA